MTPRRGSGSRAIVVEGMAPVSRSLARMLEPATGDNHVMAVTQPEPSGSALVAVLEAARSELRSDVLRGAGGRAALERYSDRVDAMLRQLFAEAGGQVHEAVVLALGGYGRGDSVSSPRY